MFLLPKRHFATLFGFAVALAGAALAYSDEPPLKDDALDRLLEKFDDAAKSKAAPKPAVEGSKPGSEPSKDVAGGPEKAKAPDAVAPKDQALDNLLEKLGESKDRPATEDEKRGGPPKPGEDGKDPMPGKPDQPAPNELTGKAKDLDEHLEELTGRKRKKKDDQGEDGSGPLGQVIKEMREVEQRLGKSETGEETRKKQTQIVKNLEQLIDQMRESSDQSKSQKKSRTVMQPGQKPGSSSGQTAGANAGGVPNSKPAKPESKHAFANGKDAWGHLPPEFRQEMDNVAREVMLPSKEELIRLYYLSVSKKSQAREE